MADIPTEAVTAAVAAYAREAYVDGEPIDGDERVIRAALDAAAPILALAVVRAILAEVRPCPEHPMPFPKPSCWTCGRNGAFHRAARIAAGLHGTGAAPVEGNDSATCGG